MGEFGLEDAGIDELSGYRIDVACSTEDTVDGCFGERDVEECRSSDFTVDSVDNLNLR